MYNASDLKKGLRVKIEGDPYQIVEFNFVKPGKGQSLYRCKLKNMLTGSVIDRTYREVDSFEPADMQEKNMQFLYKEGSNYYFMDTETYEQIYMPEEVIGDAKNFMIENLEVRIAVFQERPIGITLPNFIDLVVSEAPPWIKGDTVSGNYKPVLLETGYKIQVPPFVEAGDKIKVDTRTGDYITRVKE